MSSVTAKELVLSKLAEGIPALSPAVGKTMAEACAVCLDNQKHKKGVELNVELREDTSSTHTFTLKDWEDVTDLLKRCWNDLPYTTEQAAYGIAILLICELTEFTAIERAKKGTGFDYWLGKKEFEEDLPFKREARLEVSGILLGSKALLENRMKIKLKQTIPSDGTALPAYTVVVEFSQPISQVVKK